MSGYSTRTCRRTRSTEIRIGHAGALPHWRWGTHTPEQRVGMWNGRFDPPYAWHSAEGIASLKVSDALTVLAFYALFFQSYLQSVANVLSYLDEFIVLIALTVALAGGARTGNRNRWKTATLSLLTAYMLIGLASTLANRIQPLTPTLVDAFTCIKFALVFFAMLNAVKDSTRVVDAIVSVAKPLLLIMLLLAAVNLFVPIGGSSHQVRYGLTSYAFILPHPTYLVQDCVGLTGILMLKPRENRTWIAITCVICAMSLRSKGIAFVAIAVLMLSFEKKRRITPLDWLAVIIACLALGASSIGKYYFDPKEARGIMFRTSLTIANDEFPLGAGFGTFGTNVAHEYYSPLYYQYSLSGVWGLGEDGSFSTDAFWPALFGQFGWLGATAFVMALIAFAMMIQSLSHSKEAAFAATTMYLYVLVSSFGELSFYTPFSAVYLFFTMALVVNYRNGAKQ